MALGAINRLAPVLATADLAILTGDLTTFGDTADVFRVVAAFRTHVPAVWAVTGNLDMPWSIDALRAQGISLHGEGRWFDEIGVFGCGGSNVTPMDTPTEFSEEELASILRAGHAAVREARQTVMICHTPPFGSRLDRLRDGTPVGSPAVRAFIETYRPTVAVVGHIHEGRGADRIGETVVLNAGALFEGGYVVIDREGDRLHASLHVLPRDRA